MQWVSHIFTSRWSPGVVRTVLLLGWAGAVALGFVVLMGYQNAPGRAAEPPPTWPETSSLQPAGAQGTLVVFAHPHCPCTQATMGELERVLRYVQHQVRTYVVFVQPDGYSDDWVRDDLWQRAAAMPGVTPVRDEHGTETGRFGAFTSGQVLYFTADGHLQFAGGITGSRGHEGNNKGRQALLRWIQDDRADRSSTFVFGCALQSAPMNTWKTFDFGGQAAPRAHSAHP